MVTHAIWFASLLVCIPAICLGDDAGKLMTDAHRIYWAGNLGVFRGSADGLNVDIVKLYDAPGCRNLALDANTQRLYISRDRAGSGVWQGTFPDIKDVRLTPFTGGDCRGIAIGNNRLFVSEPHVAIYEYDLTTLRRRVVQDKGGSPLYLAYDPFDNLLFWSDPDAHAVYKLDLANHSVSELAKQTEPFGVAIGTLPRKPKEKVLFVADHSSGEVVRMAYDGTGRTVLYQSVGKKWKKPLGVAVNREGTELFVTDESARTIWKAFLESADKVLEVITNVNAQDMNDVWSNY